MGSVRDLHLAVPRQGRVLDVGCFGFQQARLSRRLGRDDVRHAGVDCCVPEELPPDYEFRCADLDHAEIPFEDDSFDLVVATHVIEHLRRPVELFGDCVRVCRPGGWLYVAAPSERSLWLPSYPLAPEKFVTMSFYDDPTHVGRPYTPQSLARLVQGYGCELVQARHEVSWACRAGLPLLLPLGVLSGRRWLIEKVARGAVGWDCSVIARKPRQVSGKPSFRYKMPQGMDDDPVYGILHWCRDRLGRRRGRGGSNPGAR